MIRPALAQHMHWPAASQRPLWAWLLSLILHVVLLTAVGLFAGRAARDAGSAGEADRPVGVALVHRAAPHPESPAEPAAAAAPSADQPSADQRLDSPASPAAATAAVPPDFAPPLDLDGVLADLTAVVGPTGGTDVAAEAPDDAQWWGERGETGRGDRGLRAVTAGSQGTTSLFGLAGSGSRFVYVVDRSDSMNRLGGRPLRAAVVELQRSLESLTAAQSFQLVLYNDQPRPYRGATVAGPVQMLQADRDTIARAQRYLGSVKAFGDTDHLEALRLALRVGPDVLFFLTDGHVPSLSPSEMADLHRLAQRSGTIIHAVEFGTEPAPHPGTFVRRLAGENGGEYRYFDVRRFAGSGTWQSETDEQQPAGLQIEN